MIARMWISPTMLLAWSLAGIAGSSGRLLLEAQPGAVTAPARRAGETTSTSHRWQIVTWASNTKEWNSRLHVTGYRIGCGNDPEQCVHRGEVDTKRDSIENIYISMPLKAGISAADASAYSALSRNNPFIVEAGFDDFVDRDQLLRSSHPDIPGFLQTVTGNIRKANSRLKFGITLYEDELDSPYIRPPLLPTSVSRQIGYVHLYLHYRGDAQFYPRYVQETHQLFPNAKILAGSYAYDRVAYIPCSPHSEEKCTPQQDQTLFLESLRIQANLLRAGRVAGIEFYPGYFGKEAQWPHWNEPDICAPERRQQCIANTVNMRRAAASLLEKILGW